MTLDRLTAFHSSCIVVARVQPYESCEHQKSLDALDAVFELVRRERYSGTSSARRRVA